MVEEGEFDNGKMHGQGKITYDSGTVMEGEFRYDRLEGKGKITTVTRKSRRR